MRSAYKSASYHSHFFRDCTQRSFLIAAVSGALLALSVFLGAAEPQLLKDLNTQPSGYEVRVHAALGGRLFFTVMDSVNEVELWASDGTPKGTVRLSAPIDPNPMHFTLFADRFFFSDSDPQHGYELWTSDGTPEGTGLFKEIPDLLTYRCSKLSAFLLPDGKLQA